MSVRRTASFDIPSELAADPDGLVTAINDRLRRLDSSNASAASAPSSINLSSSSSTTDDSVVTIDDEAVMY